MLLASCESLALKTDEIQTHFLFSAWWFVGVFRLSPPVLLTDEQIEQMRTDKVAEDWRLTSVVEEEHRALSK